jgi:hypothetical protein
VIRWNGCTDDDICISTVSIHSSGYKTVDCTTDAVITLSTTGEILLQFQ